MGKGGGSGTGHALPTKVNIGKQGKHIVGSNNCKQ